MSDGDSDIEKARRAKDAPVMQSHVVGILLDNKAPGQRVIVEVTKNGRTREFDADSLTGGLSGMTPQDLYRELWLMMKENPLCREALECALDGVQRHVATGPSDPRWQVFMTTMPDGWHGWRTKRIGGPK